MFTCVVPQSLLWPQRFLRFIRRLPPNRLEKRSGSGGRHRQRRAARGAGRCSPGRANKHVPIWARPFVFRDGSKLAWGQALPSSSTSSSSNDSKSVQQLTVAAAKGTFRWISGNSKHSAYQILTPAGTIGVRGTVSTSTSQRRNDGDRSPGGAATFSPGGMPAAHPSCDCVIAKRDGHHDGHAQGRSPHTGDTRKPEALPFLFGRPKDFLPPSRHERQLRQFPAAIEIKPTTPERARPRKASPQRRPARARRPATSPAKRGLDKGKKGQDTGKKARTPAKGQDTARGPG